MTCPGSPELTRGRVQACTLDWEPLFSQARGRFWILEWGGGGLGYLSWVPFSRLAGFTWLELLLVLSLSFSISSKKHNCYCSPNLSPPPSVQLEKGLTFLDEGFQVTLGWPHWLRRGAHRCSAALEEGSLGWLVQGSSTHRPGSKSPCSPFPPPLVSPSLQSEAETGQASSSKEQRYQRFPGAPGKPHAQAGDTGRG